jgi:hypothetical protein
VVCGAIVALAATAIVTSSSVGSFQKKDATDVRHINRQKRWEKEVDMTLKRAALIASMLLLGPTTAGADPITYAVGLSVPTGQNAGLAVAGSITTDGAMGPLQASYVLDWYLIGVVEEIVGSTNAFFTLLGPLSTDSLGNHGPNSSVENLFNIVATPLTLSLGGPLTLDPTFSLETTRD